MNPVRPSGCTQTHMRASPVGAHAGHEAGTFLLFLFFFFFRRHGFNLPVEVLTLYWGAGAVCTWGRGVKSICSTLFSPFFWHAWKILKDISGFLNDLLKLVNIFSYLS